MYDSISVISKVHFTTNVFNNVQQTVLFDEITHKVQAKYKHILTKSAHSKQGWQPLYN